MQDLTVRIIGDPILRKECTPVEHFDDSLRERIQAMFERMVDSDGIGLAAPQVGFAEQLLVIGIPMEEGGIRIKAFVNPEILKTREMEFMEEGCLSIPGLRADVERPARIQLSWQEPDGREQKAWFEDLEARVIQHEMDHLHGRLFIDHLSPEARADLQPEILRIQAEYGQTND